MSIFFFHFLNKCTKYSSCLLPDSWHRIQKIKYLCRASDSALGLVQGSCQNPSVFHFAFTDTGTLKVSLARWSSGWDKRYISKEVLKHELMWEGSQVYGQLRYESVGKIPFGCLWSHSSTAGHHPPLSPPVNGLRKISTLATPDFAGRKIGVPRRK